MNTRTILAIVCMLMIFARARAQNFPVNDVDPERLIEDLFPQQNLDINYPELYETLLQRLAHPLELNQASEEEIRSLYVLREAQVESLLRWRAENGKLLSVYELQALPDFDLETLRKLMPFVRVRDLSTTIDKAFASRIFSEGDSYLIARTGRTLEQQKGYRTPTDSLGRYAGSPTQLYVRFRISKPGDFSIGMTTEKDPGERLMYKPSRHYYGMDFISWHAQAIAKGWIKNIIIGDYTAQFGQGLVLGGGFGMGKGAETITTLRRSSLGFLPYSSVGESGFFRGAAASLALSKRITVHALLSQIAKDAVASADSISDDYSFVSSFALTGLHRTPNELKTRKQIREANTAMIIDYKTNSFQSGLIFHSTRFSLPVTKTPSPYNQFTFRGDHSENVSAYFNYSKNNFAFFGEGAKTVNAGAAVVGGVLASVTRHLDLAFLYRHYRKNFYSFYSNAIAESTVPQNESGFYGGWKYVWSKKYSASGYLDIFHFPWLRYRDYAPDDGSEWLLRFNYQPSKTILLYAQVREESKGRNLSDDATLYATSNGIKQSVWLNADYAADKKLSFKTRAQFSRYSIGEHVSRGFVLLQDATFDFGRISLSGRFSIFHSDDYDTRLYVYERDVWLAFSFPAYFGTGVHSYIVTHFRLSKAVDFWLRWSHTRYTDRSVIGSGGETIEGNTRNDVKLQTRIRLF